MEQILNVIEQLKSTNSNKEKVAILERSKDVENLSKVLFYTYNPFLRYGITEKVFNKPSSMSCANQDIFEFLDVASNMNINDNLRAVARAIVTNEDERINELYKGMMCKDLKIRMSAKSINKVFKDLIPEFGVQLAITLDKAKFNDDNFWVTEKFDGIRCVCIFKDNDIKFYSRNGKEIINLNELEKEMREFFKLNNIPDGVVFDGELLKVNENNLNSGDLYRATVSIVNSKLEDKRDIEFNIFDFLSFNEFIDGKSSKKYSWRRFKMEQFLGTRLIRKAPVLYYGNDLNEVYRLLDKLDSEGKEGIMINFDDYYVTNRSKSLIKCKKMNTVDLEIVDYKEGTGENRGKLGSFIVRYKNGNLVDVGSGYNKLQREEFWKNKDMFIGQIIEVQYFEESKNKNGDISLRFPVFRSLRPDKYEADF